MKQIFQLVALILILSLVACENQAEEVSPNKEATFTEVTLKNTVNSVEFRDYLRVREFVEARQGEPDAATGVVGSTATIDKGSLILQLEDNVSNEEFQRLLFERNLELINIYPEAAVIHVAADLSQYLEATPGDPASIEYSLQIADSIREDFEAEATIRSATPDVAMSIEATPLKLSPSSIYESSQNTNGEVTDWGIFDLKVESLWTEERSEDGVIVGFLDAGFGRHEDLTFSRLSPTSKRHNHGNHVAGVACASHNNVGVKGVVPNCFVYANADPFFSYDNSPDRLLDWQTTFGQIVADLHSALSERGVEIYNISMGYNWMPNFNINTDEDNENAARARRMVDSQGEIVLAFYRTAASHNKVIYSAAGNDSYRGDITAKYASPFNWAAIVGRERGEPINAAVVQAHDNAGRKALFSNVGGHLSCPGVNIVSAVAFNKSGSPSSGSYGTMSGTSMASPYCAGVHALISLLEPGKSNGEILDCILNNGDGDIYGAVKVDALSARNACK